MEKCNNTPATLTRYLQNKMTIDEETAFQKHLATCRNCNEKLMCMRAAIREIEQEEGSKRRWIIAVAIACSVAGGVYLLPQKQSPKTQPFEFNEPKPYKDADSTLMNDTLFLDTLETEIETIVIE